MDTIRALNPEPLCGSRTRTGRSALRLMGPTPARTTRLLLGLAVLAGAAYPSVAQAKAFTIHDECCGDFVFDDCQARSTGAPECSDGHKLVSFTGPPTIPPLSCKSNYH